MLYLVTLYSCNDQSYEDFWSSDTVIGIFDSFELAEKAVMNDYKERVSYEKENNRGSIGATEIKTNTVEENETVYECDIDLRYEQITHQWSIKAIEVNKPLTERRTSNVNIQ